MGAPCEPLTERQGLISALEAAGYDMLADVPTDWRASKTDQELRDLVEAFAEAGDIPALPDPLLPDPVFPGIAKMVEAIRETVASADAYIAAHPQDFASYPDTEAGKRWGAALDRLREILSDRDKATEASGS